MLPGNARLTRAGFQAALKKSQQSACRYFVCKWRKAPDGQSRFAVVVSLNICKKAVERNFKRRQVYEAIRLRLQEKMSIPIHAVLYAKKSLATASFLNIQQDITSLLHQISRP